MTSIVAEPGGNENNDWLISPQINLGSSGNLLSFWTKAADADYSDERFHVGISITDTDPDSFTMIATSLVPQAVEWQEFTFNLDDYAGQAVHIAINHIASDQFGFQVDDFKVETGVLSAEDMTFQVFRHYIADNNLIFSASKLMDNISIYNALGQVIVTKTFSINTESFNISELQTGVYVVIMTIDGAN